MNRLELKDRTFLAVAGQIAMLGTCDRKHVGAVLVKRGRCISWGFNGAPPGLPHCDENHHGWIGQSVMPEETPDGVPLNPVDLHGCRNATHAEANALAAAARQGISTARATLYVTVSPCDTCARLLIASGIERVVYLEEYRDESGVRLLREAGLVCQSLYSELRGGSPE
jgi:dCMP deaminase